MSRYRPDPPMPGRKGKVHLFADQGEYGPAMKAIAPRQRAFVRAYIALGGNIRGNGHRAAASAGYVDAVATARQLLSDKKVQLAIIEEGKAAMIAGGPMAIDYLMETIADPTASRRDRTRAAELTLNRAGHHAVSEHNVNVQHSLDEKQMVAQIKQMAEFLGVDPEKFLGFSSPQKVIEADYEELPQAGDSALPMTDEELEAETRKMLGDDE